MSSSHSSGSVKVIIIALIANLGIAIAKFIGAYFSKSTALLAESVHSLVDCTNQALLLIGNKKSQKAPTEKHPLGYGKEAFFWSFVVAILLFSMGGMFAIYEGIHKFSDPGVVHIPWVGLSILSVSLLLEGYSFKACLNEIKEQNPFGSLKEWVKHATSSELLVIFLEDLGALLGLIIATFSLILAWITNNMIYDAIGSVLVGCILILIAIVLAVEIKSLLIGEAPSNNYQDDFNKIVQSFHSEAKVLRFIAIQTGANEVLISSKIHPGNLKETHTLIETINKIEKEFKSKHTEVRWLFVEPDFEV